MLFSRSLALLNYQGFGEQSTSPVLQGCSIGPQKVVHILCQQDALVYRAL
jgi:hypothetical protein